MALKKWVNDPLILDNMFLRVMETPSRNAFFRESWALGFPSTLPAFGVLRACPRRRALQVPLLPDGRRLRLRPEVLGAQGEVSQPRLVLWNSDPSKRRSVLPAQWKTKGTSKKGKRGTNSGEEL